MKAAVVEKYGSPPRFADFQEPVAGEGEVIVSMSAAAVSRLVKGQAAGTHYSSESSLPLIPGNDGVGLTADGRRVYVASPRTPFGTMAERTVVRSRDMIDVPAGLSDLDAAGIANPGMSSWAALSYRAKMVAGESVLIHGATGVAGKMAIQIAKTLGAKRVIAAGRNPALMETLPEVGADELVSLTGSEQEVIGRFREAIAGGVDIVLDYLWGAPTELLFNAFTGWGGASGEARVRFVEIGGSAGPTLTLNGAVLRSSGLELMGSGLGSVPRSELLSAIAGLFQAAAQGKVSVETQGAPLSEVESVWNLDTGTRRLVLQI